MKENKKSVAFRLKPDLDAKITEILETKEKETSVKLTKTQIIELLIRLGIEKLNERSDNK